MAAVCIWSAPELSVASVGVGFAKRNGIENVWLIIGSDEMCQKFLVIIDSFVEFIE